MPKLFASIGASVAAIGALAILGAVPAFAYASQGTSGATTSPTSAGPGSTTRFTVNFKDASGAGVAGATVTFAQQSGPANCTASFSSTGGTTDANGQASTTVTLPTGCPGTFVFAGSTQGITVTASATETGGFPATSAEAPVSGIPALALAGVVLAVALICAGTIGMVRRRA